ncbi:hypothetical protein KW798_01085 [Candidatus Parcubacteria bacterium]|nr:hypothetical protein [Candidatus Parcubacteria bacterium]
MLRDFITLFLDFIAPPRETEKMLRSLTLGQLQTLSYDSDRGSLPYTDPLVKALVWELKYHGDQKAADLAGKFVAEQLLAVAADELGTPLVVPIPMHDKRRRERGHNQTELLCEWALKGMDGFEYAPKILKRIVNTVPQQGLAKHIRLKNVKKSMRVENPKNIAGRVCIVVDDVSTTGATFEEAKRALMQSGARVVHLVALAQS